MAQGVSKDCIFNEAFGHVFKSAVGAVELLPVGVGVGIDRNRTSPARLSELVSICHPCVSEKQLISRRQSLFVSFPFASEGQSPNAITEL